MKKKVYLKLLMAFILTLPATFAFAGVGTVTVRVLASDGITGVENAEVKYYKGGQQTLGFTDANGEWSGVISDVPGSTTFYAYPESGGVRIWLGIDPAANPTLEVQMVAVTIDLKKCDGTPLVGEAQYYKGGWQSIGNTPATMDLLPYTNLGPGQGSYDFKVEYNGRKSATLRQDISADPNVHFNTTTVNFAYSGPIQYYNGGWQNVVGPVELIGGTQNYGSNPVSQAEFRFGNPVEYQLWVDISGCNVGGALIQLVDESGSPIANSNWGQNLRYRSRCGGSWTHNMIQFDTDANGYALLNTSCAGNNWDGKVTVIANQTSREQLISSNNVFQLSKVNANLNTCSPTTPLAGGVVDQGGGYWYNHGTTDGSGTVSFYAFSGNNVKVKMSYNYHSVTENSVPVVFPETDIDFTTTTVNFHYPGTIQIQAGGWPVISMPIELLPGTYGFRFDGNYVGGVNISGCELEQALVFVQLRDSDDDGLANGNFDYRFGFGSYTNIGTDDTGDGIWTFIPGNPYNTKVRVSYKGASVEKQQNVQLNPMFIFHTELVTADLEESDGDDITGSGSWLYRYGFGSFSPFDPVDGEELLPVNTKVQVAYKGAAVEQQQNVGANSHFDFNTVNVTADLQESDSDDITGDASWQYRYGFGTFSPFDPVGGEELLAVNTKVHVTYKGASVEKQQNVGSDPHFDFSTVLVTADLQESDNDDITGDASWQYRYGFGAFSPFDPVGGEELLPVNTKVHVSYKGASVEQQQSVGSDPHFDFNTVSVTASLEDDLGNPLSADSWQYRYGFGGYSPFNNSGEELLPVNVKVKVTYNSTSDEKQQNAGTDPHFEFEYDGVSIKNALVAVAQKGIQLYPNPARSSVTIECQGEVNIFNIGGKLVYSGSGHTIDVSTWAKGVYMVRAEGTSQKLIIN